MEPPTMIDTVNFMLTQHEAEGVNFLEVIPPRLDPSRMTYHRSAHGEAVTSTLDNLTISVNRHRVFVKDGSLCKFIHGSNFEAMNREDIRRAVEKLSDCLLLPMERAKITRLDVAANLMMKHPTQVYINHLGTMEHRTRLQQPDSVYYTKRGEQLYFYDKIKEQKSKREPIPEALQGCNVLRYECRYTKQLPALFGVSAVTAASLYDKKFYNMMLTRWRDTYNEINKTNETTIDFEAMKGARELKQLGVLAVMAQVGGEVEFMKQLTEAQQCGKINKQRACRLRQAVKRAKQICEEMTTKNDVITELDRKIADIVAAALSA